VDCFAHCFVSSPFKCPHAGQAIFRSLWGEKRTTCAQFENLSRLTQSGHERATNAVAKLVLTPVERQYDAVLSLGAGMRRREFLGALGGVAAWPLGARAQQSERVRRVGQNMQIDIRWSAGDPNLLRQQAAEIVALTPDVVLAPGSSTAGALLQVTA
jgi:hypothetical protein